MRDPIIKFLMENYDAKKNAAEINKNLLKVLPNESSITIKDRTNNLTIKGKMTHDFEAGVSWPNPYPRIYGEVTIVVNEIITDRGDSKDFGSLGKNVYNQLRESLPQQVRNQIRQLLKKHRADKYDTLNYYLEKFTVFVEFAPELENFGANANKELAIMQKLIRYVQLDGYEIESVSIGDEDKMGSDYLLTVKSIGNDLFSVMKIENTSRYIQNTVNQTIKKYSKRDYSFSVVLTNISVRC